MHKMEFEKMCKFSPCISLDSEVLCAYGLLRSDHPETLFK